MWANPAVLSPATVTVVTQYSDIVARGYSPNGLSYCFSIHCGTTKHSCFSAELMPIYVIYRKE